MTLIPSIPFIYPEEKTFLDDLEWLAGSITSDYPDWGKHLWALFGEGLPLYQEKTTSIEQKYKFVRKVEGLYSGMGSLNDGPFSDRNEKKIAEFYDSIQNLLRVYWRSLGFEYHQESFEIFSKGTIVKLVPGKNRWFNRQGSPSLVREDVDSEKEWEIADVLGRDISNMPHYTLRTNGRICVARQEALKVIRPAKPGTLPPAPLPAAKMPFPWKKCLLLLAGLALVVLAEIWLRRLEVQSAVPVQRYFHSVIPAPQKPE